MNQTAPLAIVTGVGLGTDAASDSPQDPSAWTHELDVRPFKEKF
jgi:hypothetical protein